jgi:TRAP-type mannitol/chloroaromatic compound transport system permease small subunit
MAPPIVMPRLTASCERISDLAGRLAAVLLLVLLANVFYDVVMRYVFNDVSIGMQELEWHLYSAVFLLGIAYALTHDAHVRVDLFYERLAPRRRALIDLVGTVLLVWPFCALVAYYGVGFAAEAWDLGETSGDPGGLRYRWVVKSLVPLAFTLVLVASLGFMLRALAVLRGAPPQQRTAPPV